EIVRITVSQGVVIDPEDPSGAVVFVLVADERELDGLRDKLAHHLKIGIGREAEVPAPVLAQLAYAGPLEMFQGTPGSTLRPLPEDLRGPFALKDHPDAHRAEASDQVVSGTGAVLRPDADRAATAEGAPAPRDLPAHRDPHRPMTLLVWVSARERGD